MKAPEIFEESIDVLKTNKMRTALSSLGIIIGIGSVITLMTLGKASQESIRSRIQSLGANLLTIRSGAQREGFIFGGSGGVTTLTYSDALEILNSKRINTVDSVAGEYSSRSQVSFERNNTNVSISGIAGNYYKLRNLSLSSGRFLTEEDNNIMAKYAVLGSEVVDTLFTTNVNPVNEKINIDGQEFTVIGTLESKGGNLDDTVYVPLQTAQKVIFGVTHLNTIYVGAKDETQMEAAQNQVGYLLLELHKKLKPEDADFSIFSQEDLLETVSEVTNTFTTLLTGIAAISLIVGGIGIMNIMLVTVTERTSEIGLRKALGAKRKTIITQFLMESVILTISGGIIGVVIGVVTSLILTKVMSLPNIIAWNSILIAVAVSCVIGVTFGIYPALKASRLQPIEALRYE